MSTQQTILDRELFVHALRHMSEADLLYLNQRWRREVGQFFNLFKWILCGLSCRVQRQLVKVNRIWGSSVKRGMRSAAVVKVEVPRQRLLCVRDRFVAV